MATGAQTPVEAGDAASSPFDCFYVYPTVSNEKTMNSDLVIGPGQTGAAVTQASRFSQVCKVYAPMYRQVTASGLAASPGLAVPARWGDIAYDSLLSGFQDYLAHYNDGRPIIFIGHSQGAAMLIDLLARVVDRDAALRSRMVVAIVLGGDVEVPTGKLVGGSFETIPTCSTAGESGCVIAYSTFPGEPPATALFGRPGVGVALQSGQSGSKGLSVVCVNPAAIGGGVAVLDPFFPSGNPAGAAWVSYPGLYTASCESSGGATWLQVSKANGPSDHRPVISELLGPDWGYHTDDVNLALGNLVSDVAAAESSWAARQH
ncbi:MAG TPA: DUF3089 domain-containing protein [Acidimicrobiales bacterium]|nr:DUF3089 domain-containing protein [Acidimicrobiales bacterium]